jgi:hypothetical protein
MDGERKLESGKKRSWRRYKKKTKMTNEDGQNFVEKINIQEREEG